MKDNIIQDWFDFVCIIGLDFMLIVIGTYILPRVLERAQLIFALSIALTSVYFTRKIIYFLIFKYTQYKNDN